MPEEESSQDHLALPEFNQELSHKPLLDLTEIQRQLRRSTPSGRVRLAKSVQQQEQPKED